MVSKTPNALYTPSYCVYGSVWREKAGRAERARVTQRGYGFRRRLRQQLAANAVGFGLVTLELLGATCSCPCCRRYLSLAMVVELFAARTEAHFFSSALHHCPSTLYQIHEDQTTRPNP